MTTVLFIMILLLLYVCVPLAIVSYSGVDAAKFFTVFVLVFVCPAFLAVVVFGSGGLFAPGFVNFAVFVLSIPSVTAVVFRLARKKYDQH